MFEKEETNRQKGGGKLGVVAELTEEQTIQATNLGSARLVQKLGFEAFKTEMRQWPTFNGGGEREIVHWRRSR